MKIVTKFEPLLAALVSLARRLRDGSGMWQIARNGIERRAMPRSHRSAQQGARYAPSAA